MDWTPDHILKATAGRLLYGRPDAHFDGVAIDSRTIAAGQLFVAIRGEKHDGHTFIEQVAAKGVRGIIVSADTETTLPHARWRAQGVTCVAVADTTTALGRLAAYQRGRSQIPVVAITGSNGKTTTRQMTTLVMARRFNTLSTEGNFNNEIGLPLTLFRLSDDHQAAVLELGMNHPGEMTRLGAICRPTMALITMVGPAHLEFLGSLEGVARAKGELMAQVLPDGVVALNADDPHVAALAQQTDRRCVFFGTGNDAQVRARSIREAAQGVAFDLELPGETIPIALKTPGRFMVTNALAAATAGHLAGLRGAEIKAGLEAFSPGKGRLHVLTSAGGVHVIDDTYNANPASMAAAIDTLTALRKAQPGIIILGDMLELGEQAERLHRELGAKAGGSGAERLYAHGPHGPVVRQGALEAGMPAERIMVGAKEEIVADLLPRLSADHWVLVKGSRGMAMETVVAAIHHQPSNQRASHVL
ncbi:MAG: UDP-N-acetylmuramoyl-tripeptide--D-alanyl-D-alanine ligase [Desulfobacterales bacterium]|nr:UDP-N-acetylmuramoyl-tripeptide--D-alanyl-D-alanine ligase [Desulfobacterales bacterium]